jgi:hypothetical protein
MVLVGVARTSLTNFLRHVRMTTWTILAAATLGGAEGGTDGLPFLTLGLLIVLTVLQLVKRAQLA